MVQVTGAHHTSWNKADIPRETFTWAQGQKGLGLDSLWKLLEDFETSVGLGQKHDSI